MANSKGYWYFPDPLGGSDHLGPFTKEEVLRKIERKEVRVDQFISGSHLSDGKWLRIFEIDEFRLGLPNYPIAAPPPAFCAPSKAESRRVPTENLPRVDPSEVKLYEEGNLFRRFPRVPIHTDLIIHNQMELTRGFTLDISESGIFFQSDGIIPFEKGEEVTAILRDKGMIGTVAMHAVLVRVSKEQHRDGFALHFLRVNPDVRRKIAEYVLRVLHPQNKIKSAA